jgi:hypothetical protein
MLAELKALWLSPMLAKSSRAALSNSLRLT